MSEANLDMALELLDRELDDIEDLPGFEAPVPGEYVFKMTTTIKDIKGATCVEASYEVVECIKQDNDADTPTIPGTKFSNLYTIKGDGKDAEADAERVKMGLGKLKELLAGIAESTGQGNLAVLIRDVVASAVVRATVKQRVDSKDKDKIYGVVKNLALA